MKFEIAKIGDGWLSMNLSADGSDLYIGASDAYTDSIGELVDALSKISNGRSSEIRWYLEPTVYKQTFEIYEDTVFVKVVEEVDNSISLDSRVLFECTEYKTNLLEAYSTQLAKVPSFLERVNAWSWDLNKDKLNQLISRG